MQLTADIVNHHFDVFVLNDEYPVQINNFTVLGGRVQGSAKFTGNFNLLAGVLDIGWDNAAELEITGNFVSTANSTVLISVYSSTNYDSMQVVYTYILITIIIIKEWECDYSWILPVCRYFQLFS